MAYNPKDRFFLKAKRENFVARSVYKLEEIHSKFAIFRHGDRVLDLGAAPGSWSQLASTLVGPSGRVVGIDLQEIDQKSFKKGLSNMVFLVGDATQYDWKAYLADQGIEKFNVVLSDMAPRTTGIRSVDQARSFELCDQALQIACRLLSPGGHFVCKLFHSHDFAKLREALRAHFRQVDAIRPESTRSESKEIFLVGRQFSGRG